MKRFKKFLGTALALTVCTLSIFSSTAVFAMAINVEESDLDKLRENLPEIQSYAAGFGNLTDRFLFYNGPYHPCGENYSSKDLSYNECIKYFSNITLADNPWQSFHDCSQSGRCLGMTSLEVLAHNKVFSPSDIQNGKQNLIDIECSILTGSCIEDSVMATVMCYQMRQLRQDYNLYAYYNIEHYNKDEKITELLEKAQKATDEGKYFTILLNEQTFFHAVTGIGIVDGEWYIDNQKFDKCIITNDTNVLHKDEETGNILSGGADPIVCIYVNSETKDVCVPFYVLENYTDYDNFKIITLDDDFINFNGKINPTYSYKVDLSDINRIEILSDNDYTLNVCRTDGTEYDGIASCNEIFKKNGIVYLCDGNDFDVYNTGKADIFSTNFMNVNQAVNTNFRGIVDKVSYKSGSLNFNALSDTEYDVSLIFENGCYDFAPHYRFDFSGVTGSDFKAVQTDRGIIISSSDRIQCQIKVTDIMRDENGFVITDIDNNKTIPAETSQNDSIMTNNNVLLTFDENGNLTYYIGENYEKKVQKGDVNCDGFIDASDASFVLQAYSALSTGGTTYLSKNLADWDYNGLIDASDASFILQKYAELSTTKS